MYALNSYKYYEFKHINTVSLKNGLGIADVCSKNTSCIIKWCFFERPESTQVL